jgi:hypothetical protein
MTFVSTALAMVAVIFGLGAPAALLLLPRRWRMHWPVVAPLAGVALVSLVTWIGVSTGQRVTATWVWLTVAVVPVPILVVSDRRRLLPLVIGGLRRHVGVLGLAVLALLAIARPLVLARLGLTSVSFGSCDAADYAGGAALLRDIEPDDLSGFNGQTETVALRSVDTFYGHWMRINHFAPAAMLAWFSVLFGLPLFKLVTALGIALHAAAVPAVFWVARAGLRLGSPAALAVAAGWACSAPAIYGVAQTALGQVMVVPAVAVLTWAGLRAQAEGGSWRGALRWAPLVAAGLVVLVAAYTFALVFVLAPLAAALVWLAWLSGRWDRLLRAAGAGFAALAVVGVVFRERIAGLADRFALFEAIDFGWPIPVFTPERWLGWFGDARLAAGGAGVGWALVLVAGGAWLAYAAWAWRRDRRAIGVAMAWLAAAAGGYTILALKGVSEGSNELYNAYKVFALLQPLALAALAVPLRGARCCGHAGRIVAAILAVGLVAVHWAGSGPVREALRQPVLWVDKPLQSIATIAARGDVDSVNMVLEPMWARLWANSMLLNKRQFFRSETYEGRRATPLRGTWDLRDGLLAIDAGGADTIQLVGGYHLVRRAGAGDLQLDLGPGWHAPEGGGVGRWVWSAGREALLRVTHSGTEPLRVRLDFGLQGNGRRSVVVAQDGRADPLWTGTIDVETSPISLAGIGLAPGETLLRIRSAEPASAPPGDGRELGFALHALKATIEGRNSRHE